MKVSVVTVVKEHPTGLKVTFESLLKQTFFDWEMIIVVGTSRDATLLVAQEIRAKDSRVRIIEQHSVGIYGAMNEGVAAATGEFIWFMNAGDKFTTVEVLMSAIIKLSQSDEGMLIGGYAINNGNTNQTYFYPERDVTALSFAFNRRGGCHQAMIFRTQILKNIGGFDTAYSLASDFDLVLRVIKLANARRVSEVYATIEPGGRADQGIFEVHKQKHRIRRNLLGGPVISIASVFWTGLARAKIISRSMFRKVFSK